MRQSVVTMKVSRWFPWLLRVGWLALPFTAGPALEAALRQHSFPVALAGAIGLWTAWAVVLVAVLVPHPLGLTALRITAPAAVAACVAAAIDGHPSALAVGWTAAVAALAFLPETGVWLVNGSAYPNERRHLLRIPASLLLGPVPLAWAIVVGAPAAGVLLLAARAWVAGAVVLVAGGGGAVVLARSLHGLSRRW